MEIKRNITTQNFNNSSTSRIKYIVIHYTSNDGDTAYGNTKYSKEYRGASAHYFVDENSIYQSIEDKNVAWHCGANSYKHPYCRNSNSLGVELCSRKDKRGNYYFKDGTVKNAVELVKMLMAKYDIPIANVIRHYDVTGKICPEPYVHNIKAWHEFKNKLTSKVTQEIKKEEQEMVTEGKAVVNGKEYKIDRILKDGNNYIKATNFRNMGFDVAYDADTKMLKITNSLTEVKINSKGKSVGVGAVNVNGYNYISVRELCNILGLEISYNNGEIDIK